MRISRSCNQTASRIIGVFGSDSRNVEFSRSTRVHSSQSMRKSKSSSCMDPNALGYTGETILDSGFIHLPYIPMMETPVPASEEFIQRHSDRFRMRNVQIP